ncbi:membrane frizzled-related protein [Genypterus blacodes]|uniref:membrane frizzled-related protein n=1 Tax=Genypterus blacodes TaxID=154954 RepID=UPI003F765453
MSDLSQVAVYSESSDIYKNVFCNPAFELEGEREEKVEGFRTSSSTPEPIKPPTAGLRWCLFGVCMKRLQATGCGWGVVLLSAAVLLLVAALGLALALILTQIKDQAVEEQTLSTSPPDLAGDGVSSSLPTIPANRSQWESATTSQPARFYPSDTRCGGVLTDTEGSFSSPNHPGSYPPNTQCVWAIQVQPPSLVQIHVSSLSVEGPSPCLFDWLEVQEQLQQSSVVTRFCGNVAPPTINTNNSNVWVTFRSDSSIAGSGFTAQYRAILPGHMSCSREEFMCDRGRCLLPVSVCNGQPNCQDQTDEANCSHKHKECGGEKNGQYGYLASPNHPKPYPHQQLCVWHISVAEGHVITLSFRNFSLETQDVCEFDYVEVHDSANSGAGRVLGRFCGTSFPPDLISSGPHMTVVFVADEGVADIGFNATYHAVSLLDRTCGPNQFACSTGECLQQQWLCDGWNDCSDGADEQGCANSTYPPFTASSCELIEVEMCQGLSYNLTSFPNIWLSIADQREAATLLRQYRVLMELACFEALQQLVCGLFLPQCSPQGGVLQPCRSICTSAEQQCSHALDLLSFSWPFNCHLLPDSQDPLECSLP